MAKREEKDGPGSPSFNLADYVTAKVSSLMKEIKKGDSLSGFALGGGG
jgi:hypothetical protein